MPQHIQHPNGRMGGSVGDGRDEVPTRSELFSAAVELAQTPEVNLRDVLADLTRSDRDAYMFHGVELDVTAAQVAVLEDRRSEVVCAFSREDGRLALVVRDMLPPNPRRIYDAMGQFHAAARSGHPLLPTETDVTVTDGDDPVQVLRGKYGVDSAILPVYADASGTVLRLCHPADGATLLAGWSVIDSGDVRDWYGDLEPATWDTALARAQRELSDYQGYLVGECFNVEVYDETGRLADESFAHFDLDEAVTEADL